MPVHDRRHRGTGRARNREMQRHAPTTETLDESPMPRPRAQGPHIFPISARLSCVVGAWAWRVVVALVVVLQCLLLRHVHATCTSSAPRANNIQEGVAVSMDVCWPSAPWIGIALILILRL